jgi:hypothetical protein
MDEDDGMVDGDSGGRYQRYCGIAMALMGEDTRDDDIRRIMNSYLGGREAEMQLDIF